MSKFSVILETCTLEHYDNDFAGVQEIATDVHLKLSGSLRGLGHLYPPRALRNVTAASGSEDRCAGKESYSF